MRLFLAVCLLLLAPSLLPAQRAPLPLSPGERVRLRLRAEPDVREGILLYVGPRALHLRDSLPPVASAEQVDTIPVALIRVLHVYRPNADGQRAAGAISLGLLGAVAGTFAGLGLVSLDRDRSGDGMEKVFEVLAGTLVGSVAGATFGATRTPSPWVHIPVPRSGQR